MVLHTTSLDLAALVLQAAGGESGPAVLVTRELGSHVRHKIEKQLELEQSNTLLLLDFSGIGIIDFSCADEVVAKLLTRLQAMEFGEKFIALTRVTPSHRENIGVALERKKLAVLAVEKGYWEVLGDLKHYLDETLQQVMEQKRLTARLLATRLGLELNTSSTRLINLYKARLVARIEEGVGEGGRQFVYQGLI
jgi:hypothetical protein